MLRISPEFLIDKPGILFIGLSIISNYDVIIDFCIDSAWLAASFKMYNVIMT